jgi:DNA-binding beta-propeller fold protein YncE
MIHAALLTFGQFALGAFSAPAQATATRPRVVTKRRGWMRPDADPNHTWMYLSGFGNDTVGIYDLDRLGTPKIGEISRGLNGPAGITLGAQGNLYVVNFLGATVTIYAPGATTPSLTLSQSLTVPVGVAVDASGNVYVTNSTPSPSIVVYPPGQTAPSQTIASDLIIAPNAITFDGRGNLYFSDEYSLISEIPKGQQTPISLGLQGIHNASGIAIDPLSGNLFVSTLNDGSAVHVFAPGSAIESYELKDSANADFVTIGNVRRHEYLFAPDSLTPNMRLFRVGKKEAHITLSTEPDAHQAAVKPPGTP